MEEFKMEQLHEDLLLDLHTRFPNTIDDNAKLFGGRFGFEKGKAHGCIYSGKVSIINEKKGIQLDFKIWFSVYCEAYQTPEIKPNIESYLTGEYFKIQKASINIPGLGLEAVVLLNIPKARPFEDDPKKKNYYDAYWYVFETDEGHTVLSKEGWFGTYVYDKKFGMRPATEEDWVDIGDGRKKLREGLEIVRDIEPFKSLIKEFMMKKYTEKITPDMYIEL